MTLPANRTRESRVEMTNHAAPVPPHAPTSQAGDGGAAAPALATEELRLVVDQLLGLGGWRWVPYERLAADLGFAPRVLSRLVREGKYGLDKLVRVGPNGRRGALLREVIEWQHTYRPSIESGGRANPAALADSRKRQAAPTRRLSSRFVETGEPGAASVGHVSARRS